MTDQNTPDGAGEKKIIVDEDWKAEVERERAQKQSASESTETAGAEDQQPQDDQGTARRELPPANFVHFISGIATQALMQLGEIENPFLGKKTVDLDAARYSIDIIGIIEEKTRGNLEPDEEHYLKAAIQDLRMRFVMAARGDAGPEKTGGQPAQ